MPITILLVLVSIAALTAVVASAAAGRGRSLVWHGLALFILCVVLRIGGSAAFSVATGDPDIFANNPLPRMDENVFLRISRGYFVQPRGWYDELLLKDSTRFGAALHAVHRLAPQADLVWFRLVSVFLASSGICAVWAATHRRFGPAPARTVALLAAVWPYGAMHDVGMLREPWLTFSTGWFIALMAIPVRLPGWRPFGVASLTYLLYLLQPHAAICTGFSYIYSQFGGWTSHMRRGSRVAIVVGALAAFVLVAGRLIAKIYLDEVVSDDLVARFARDTRGGSAFWTPGPSAPLWLLVITNSAQYWLGGLFVGMTSMARLLGLVDYAFWVPIYISIVAKLRGQWPRDWAPERFALSLFATYNIVSMAYVTNVGLSIRKRNALGLCCLYLLGPAINAWHKRTRTRVGKPRGAAAPARAEGVVGRKAVSTDAGRPEPTPGQGDRC